jgi:hypothetical protein
MKHVFKVGDAVVVPDGTSVYPIIGPRQLFEDKLPMFAGMSLAMGELPPHTVSEIHIHPIVDHLTWVVQGELTVRMKGPEDENDYQFEVATEQLALTKAQTFFQLINNTDRTVTTLYGVAPAFVFELDDDGNILYNDQIVPGLSWKELRERDWKIPEMSDIEEIRKLRLEALKRLSKHG